MPDQACELSAFDLSQHSLRLVTDRTSLHLLVPHMHRRAVSRSLGQHCRFKIPALLHGCLLFQPIKAVMRATSYACKHRHEQTRSRPSGHHHVALHKQIEQALIGQCTCNQVLGGLSDRGVKHIICSQVRERTRAGGGICMPLPCTTVQSMRDLQRKYQRQVVWHVPCIGVVRVVCLCTYY